MSKEPENPNPNPNPDPNPKPPKSQKPLRKPREPKPPQPPLPPLPLPPGELFIPISKASRDLSHAKKMSIAEVRYAVDLYYQIQTFRQAAGLQVRAADKAQTPGPEPSDFLLWTFSTMKTVEDTIKRALDRWTDDQIVGRWAKSIVGIGPVISAGLLARIDMGIALHAGHIFKFAGLDPSSKWEKGKKRPWNAALKRLCWLIGQSFMKNRNREGDVYGHIYAERKQYETTKNALGDYAAQAREKLANFKIGKDTEAWAWYSGCFPGIILADWMSLEETERARRVKEMRGQPGSGVEMLPPARIELRAERYAVKMFLSHWHAVAFEVRYQKKAPRPWIIEFGGHVDMIEPPNWPMTVDKPF